MGKMSYVKKIFAASLAAVVTVAGVPLQTMTTQADDTGLIAEFTFDDATTGFSGAGATANIQGSGELADSYDNAGKALSVSSGNWLDVTKDDGTPLLAGLEEITISYDSKSSTSDNKGWAFFAAPDTSTQSYPYEHYLGIIDLPSSIEVERFNNSGSRPGNSITASSTENWKHVDLVVTETTSTLYVDGVKQGEHTSDYKLSDILGASGGTIQIGKANWGSGEYFKGLIDNLKIYNRAKTEVEVAADAPVITEGGTADLIAQFTFDDADSGFSGAGAIADIQGTGELADSYDDAGKALSVSSGNWLYVTKEDGTPLLAGLEEITISYDSKPSASDNSGWAFFAAPDTSQQSWPYEHYLGIMDLTSGMTVERYDNYGSRPGNNITASSTENWKHVDLVITETTSTLYVDGVKQGEHTSSIKLSDILGASGGTIQIGKANWGSGEYFKGLIDNLKIYSKAKTEEEVAADAPVIYENADDTTPFASYAFNGDATDSSGNGYDGEVVGDDAAFGSKRQDGIVFPSGTDQIGVNYVKLNDGILGSLQDANELTVTAWVYNNITNTNANTRSTVFSFGADANNSFSFATLNWANARTTFMINGAEVGADYQNNDNTGIIYNTEGNVSSPLQTWYQIAVTFRDLTEETGVASTQLKYYLNGELICNVVTPSSISSLGNLTYAYIGTGNNSGFKDFQGSIRGVNFIGSVLTSNQIKANYTSEELYYQRTDDEIVQDVYDDLAIPSAEAITGNITLLDEMDGAAITWEKVSGADVITMQESTNANYDSTPAGVVTRGNQDETVVLKATISKGAVQSLTKEFTLTIKAKSDFTEDDYAGYLFAYFKGEGYSNGQGEQIYFAVSDDGLNWTDLNNSEPVFTSTLGEKGLRDPFIIRSPEGDKFYLIATDLRIDNGNGWTAAQESGSQSIMIWESTDMVNWSEQRMAKIALDNAGCTWAPEAYYDELTGEYVVFWASKTSDDSYKTQKVYYSKTRDFYTFTEPQVWIELYNADGSPLSIIDTSVISVIEDGSRVYYRFSKNEATQDHDKGDDDKSGGKYTIMEKSDSMLGTWTEVTALTDERYVEGGTCFKFFDRDEWCLLLDDNGGVGYYPLTTTDLSSGQFTKLSSSEYSFPGTMRHGTVIALTQEEYDAVREPITITYEAGANGSIEGETTQTVYKGSSTTTVKAVADEGYTFSQWSDGNTNPERSDVASADVTYTATFVEKITINYEAGANGSIEGETTQTVEKGSSTTTVTAIADEGYTFSKWSDGSNNPERSDVAETNATYTATFEKAKANEVTITYIAGANGKITGETSQTVTVGSSTSKVVAVANEGYEFSKWSDGSTNPERSDVADANATYTATFVKKAAVTADKVTITYKAGANGKITGQTTQTVTKGSKTSKVVAVANEGYEFSKWSDGSTKAERTDTANGSVTYTATFVKKVTNATSVKLNVSKKITIGKKETVQLKATVSPSAASQKVTWKSSKKSVVSVTSKGKIKGKKVGKAKITATTANGKKVTCTVTVKKAPKKIKKVTLNTKKTTLKKGKTYKIKVKLPAKTASYKLTYKSSNKKVATVNAKGKITTKKKGTAKITVKTFNKKKYTITIKVK